MSPVSRADSLQSSFFFCEDDGTLEWSGAIDSAAPGHFLNWPMRASFENCSPRVAIGMIDVGTPDWEMLKMFRTVLTRE